MKMKKKEWYAKVKADGDCKYIACDECPFSLERGSRGCANACDAEEKEQGKSAIPVQFICKRIMGRLEKKWAKKAEKLKELGGGI